MTIAIAAVAGPISVWREGQFLYVDPPGDGVLRGLLRTTAWSCRPTQDGAVRAGRRLEPLYEVEQCGGRAVLKCWAGLTPVVLAVLKLERREPKTVSALFHTELPQPAGSLTDHAVLDFLGRHDRGLIRYHRGAVEPARLVAQVARAWPDRTVTAVVARRDDAAVAVKQLRASGLDAFAFTARNQPVVETRVAVATYDGMAYMPVAAQMLDIVVALDAVEALGDRPRWCLQHLDRARLYGLLDANRLPSPCEQDLLHCLFGFEAVQLPRPGLVMRPVEVAWVQGQGRRLRSEPTDVLELKHYAVWNQDERNRQVARLARAAAAGGVEDLAAMLPKAAPAALPAGPRRVLVLVENVEHALILMNKLPHWPVFTSGLRNLDGLSTMQAAALETRRFGPESAPPPVGIVTQAGLRSCDTPLCQTDVLIRADGGVGLPGLPPSALVRPAHEASRGPLLAIDFDDGHHPELRRRVQQRRHAYLEAGWPAPGRDGAFMRIKQFLLTRPEGGRP